MTDTVTYRQLDDAQARFAEPIPLFSPLLSQRDVADELSAVVSATAASGQYILGPEVESFEAELAAWLGGGVTAVGVASGTDALYLVLRALDIGQGDEVITTPLTFVATTEAICRVGARPVFCDIDVVDCNIDAAQVTVEASPRTRALLPVHLFGAPCDMELLAATARRYGIPLVEDVAQALGGRWKGSNVGTLGEAAAASFFPTKTLGAMGDAGAAVSSDDTVIERIRSLRFHGISDESHYAELGSNSRLDALQAAVLRVKLRALSGQLEERRRIAELYDEALAGHEHIRPLERRPDADSAFGLYSVWVNEGRDDLRRYLTEKLITTRVYYPVPLHLQPALRHLGYRAGDLPQAEAASRCLLSLPLFPGMPLGWQHHVAEVTQQWRPSC